MSLKSKKVEELQGILKQTCAQFPQHAEFPAAIIKVKQQTIYLFIKQEMVAHYPVSTSRYGVGQEEGSNQTPLGVHCIQDKIGADAAACEIFLSRESTNSIATVEKQAIGTEKDCITSRILWLSGLQNGYNKGSNSNGVCVDSHQRYIYIHGTHEEGLVGQEASIGCIRMKNEDVIEIFDRLMVSSLVIIEE